MDSLSANGATKAQKWLNQISIGVLFCVLIIAIHCLFTWIDSEKLITSDESSELILGKILAKENSIITSKWNYSTEVRILNTNLVYSLAFKITEHFKLVRVIAQFICLGALYLCQMFFYKSARSRYYAVWPLLLLLPLSEGYYRFVLFGLYYIPHICISFLCLGILFYVQQNCAGKRLMTIAAAILSFLAGMGGLRQLVILNIPVVFVALYYVMQSESSYFYKRWKTETQCYVQQGIIMLATSLAGYLINSKVLHQYFHFQSYGNIALRSASFDALFQMIRDGISLLGFRTGLTVLSLNGIESLMAFVLWGCIFFSLYLLYRFRDKLNRELRFLFGYSVIVNLLIVGIYMFSDMEYLERYLIPNLVFLIPCMVLSFEWGIYHKKEISAVLLKNIKTAGIMLVLALIAVSHLTSKTVTAMDYNVEMRKVEQFLTENDYDYGYATFWCANLLTELSDGKIDMFPFYSAERIDAATYNELIPFKWLVSQDVLNMKKEEKVFVLVELNDIERFGNEVSYFQDEKRIVFHTDKYYIYSFENSEELYEELSLEYSCGTIK